MALTARFKEQAAAQLGECGWRSEVRQLGACLKPTHHLVTVQGVREGAPNPKALSPDQGCGPTATAHWESTAVAYPIQGK